MTEQELRVQWQATANKCRTLHDLMAFKAELDAYDHDYGSCCVAIGAFAVAATWVAARSEPIGRGGITGFQAGAVMWEFISGWMQEKGPQRLVKYHDLLFPQMEHEFRTISAETWDWVKGEAVRHLAEGSEQAHPDVRAHWESIAAGHVPFGFAVEAS